MWPKPFYVIRAWIAIATLAMVLAYLWNHEPFPALPDVISGSLIPNHEAEFRLGAIDAVKDVVGLVTTIAFGLSAVVGFALKDGLGSSRFCQIMNLLAAGAFIYFLARVFVLGYDSYASIAVQLDSGYIFVGRLEESIHAQAEALVSAAALALFLLFVSLLRIRHV